jgi:hypothetical protein
MRTYAQSCHSVVNFSGSLAAAEILSGSQPAQGFAKLVGIAYTDAVSETGSGMLIQQSADQGENWDIISSSNLASASAASSFSVDVVGNAVKVSLTNGAGTASEVRCNFYLRPI